MADHAPAGLCVQVSRVGAVVTIALAGEIDCTSLAVARQAFCGAGGEHGVIVFDLSEVTFCDCAGVHFLIEARSRVLAAGGQLSVRGPRPAVRRVLELTGALTALCPGEPAAS